MAKGIYDLFTIEDLNYGFDRFWLRRKLRNHRVRFRFFPGPWMRSFKKQLAKPRLESHTGPRMEFFRILFEQVLKIPSHFWINRQRAYDEYLARVEYQKTIEEGLEWSKTFPYAKMASLGWVEPTTKKEAKVINLFEYF